MNKSITYQIRLRIEVATENVVGMTLECLETFARTQLPEFQGLVVRGADQQP